VAEQGFKGFEMTQWDDLLAPSKWPKSHIAKLEAEAIKATRSSMVKDKLGQDLALSFGITSAEFDAFIKAEQVRGKPVIARAEIKPEGV
jgi:tripartite-type tricarboxylate transporter receptor subunit TctC